MMGRTKALVLAAALIGTSGLVCAQDEAYMSGMSKTIADLNALYAKANDKNIPQGEAEQARIAAFRKAREALKTMDKRFDTLKGMEGAALTPSETLMNIHIMTMLLDMVASEHLPHKDTWSYTE